MSGKSVACSQLIDHIQKQQNMQSAFYLCSYSFNSTDTCTKILRTVAAQLIQSQPELVAYIYRSYVDAVKSTSTKRMKDLLREILSSLGTCRVVLDGIDECSVEQQKEIISTFLSLQDSASESCKVLFSSRNDESHIKRSLARKTVIQLKGQTDDAIILYVKHKVDELSHSFEDLSGELLSRVRQRTCAKAQGIIYKSSAANLLLKYLARDVLVGAACFQRTRKSDYGSRNIRSS